MISQNISISQNGEEQKRNSQFICKTIEARAAGLEVIANAFPRHWPLCPTIPSVPPKSCYKVSSKVWPNNNNLANFLDISFGGSAKGVGWQFFRWPSKRKSSLRVELFSTRRMRNIYCSKTFTSCSPAARLCHFHYTALLYRHQSSYRLDVAQPIWPSKFCQYTCTSTPLPHPQYTHTLYPIPSGVLYLVSGRALLKLVLRADSCNCRLDLCSSFKHFKLVIYNLETLFSWPCFLCLPAVSADSLADLLFVFKSGKGFELSLGHFSYPQLWTYTPCTRSISIPSWSPQKRRKYEIHILSTRYSMTETLLLRHSYLLFLKPVRSEADSNSDTWQAVKCSVFIVKFCTKIMGFKRAS